MNLGSTLIIGDEPCTFNAVCETIINAKTATVILSKPMELARALEIPSYKLVEIREKQVHTSAPSLLFEILTSWRAQKSSDATLQAFVLVLESLQWNDCADELKKKFFLLESTSFEDSPTYKPVLSQQVVSLTERSNMETLRSPLQVIHQRNLTSSYTSPRSPSPTLTQDMDSTGTDTSLTNTPPASTPSKPQWPSDSLPKFHSSIPKCKLFDSHTSKEPLLLKETLLQYCNDTWSQLKRRVLNIGVQNIIVLISLMLLLILLGVFIGILIGPFVREFFESEDISKCRNTDKFIFVNSFLEYQSKVKGNCLNNISLHISAREPEDWGQGFVLPNIEKITEIILEGPISINTIYEIFHQSARFLTRLSLLDNGNSTHMTLCNFISPSMPSNAEMITMQSVKYFYLNFEVCDRVFNLLMGYTKFPNVVQFGFVFDSERFAPQSFSLQLIKRVFTTSIQSLKSVAIHKIGSAGPFNQHTHTLERMPNVSDLSLRAMSHCNSKCSYYFDYPYLFNVFPNLKKLEIDGFILPYGLSMLSNLKSTLVDLKVAIELNDMYFDLNVLPPQLSNVQLFLSFLSCNKSGEFPKLSGLDSFESSASVQITTNCEFLTTKTTAILNFIKKVANMQYRKLL